MINAKTPEIHEIEKPLRGWDALEEKLKARGLSSMEIQEAQKSYYDGIDALAKMFLKCFSSGKTEKKTVV